MAVVAFILIFSLVVVAHEFGHYIVAKANGIHVVEFSIGMGPKLVSFHRRGTRYCIKLLPIGGACMFEGEDVLTSSTEEGDDSVPLPELSNEKPGINNEDSVQDEMQRKASRKPADRESNEEKGKYGKAFPKAPVYARIATVIAGPLFNILLAYFLSLFIVAFCGADEPVVEKVMEGYPAEEAGIEAGDRIVKMDHEKIYLWKQVAINSQLNAGEEIDIVYERDGKQYETTIIPAFSKEDGRYFIGFVGYGEVTDCANIKAFKYGAYEVNYWLNASVKSLKMLVKGKVTKDDVAGPVGITQIIDETIDETKSYGFWTVFINMMNIAMLLSVNLGVLNLIPFPALDGGRLFFLLIEAVRRKPIPPEREGIVNLVGFIVLMLLMVFVLFNDISRLFH